MGVELQTRSFKFGSENNAQLDFIQASLGAICDNASQAVRHCVAYTFMEIKLHGPERVIQGLLCINKQYQLNLFE